MQASLRYVPGAVVGNDVYGKFFIDILDDQGNPTNGNNIQVEWKRLLNGVQNASGFLTIAGQSSLLYDGITKHNSDVTDYTLTGVTVAGTGQTVLIPDAKIVSVEILQKADLAGQNGIVYINATTTHYVSPVNPGYYFIDDYGPIPPKFEGLTAGVHVAKFVDGNNDVATLQFTMPKVNSILVSDPSRTIAGKVSRWNAAFNPIVFTYQRRDFDVISITKDDTTLKPKLNINTNTGVLQVGDVIYLDYSPYKGAYKVLNIVNESGIIIIDTNYLAPTANEGFVNIDVLRPYYKVSTLITYVSPLTGLLETVEHTARPINGIVKADISSLLQSILSPQNDQSNYTLINYRDKGLSASYTVQYAEVWDGKATEYVSITTPYYVTYTARQIQQAGGGNMYPFVTQPGGQALAKWLTDFREPLYSVGYPFDLPFIYSEQIAGRQLYYKILLLDINRVQLNVNAYTAFLLNDDGSYILNQDGSKFVIAKQDLFNTPIVEQVGLNRLLINQDYGALTYYLSVQLFYDQDGASIAVTEPIITRVDKSCNTNAMYFRWIGLNGAWNYYRFNYNQDVSLDIQNATIIKQYVSDYETAEGVESVISKDAGTKVQVWADGLDRNSVDGLQSIKYSPMVQNWINGRWQTIVINSTTFAEYSTELDQNDISFTFNNPSLNIQTQ